MPRNYQLTLIKMFTGLKSQDVWKHLYVQTKAGFPVIAENTRSYVFSIEILQVILTAMVLVPSFFW